LNDEIIIEEHTEHKQESIHNGVSETAEGGDGRIPHRDLIQFPNGMDIKTRPIQITLGIILDDEKRGENTREKMNDRPICNVKNGCFIANVVIF
jgi:hypothetical protein